VSKVSSFSDANLNIFLALLGSNLFLAADTTTKTHLTGRIIPQSGSDLDTIGALFSQYLQGDNITLIAQGDSVVPTGSTTPISWLSGAFKTLSLSITLPGQRYTVSSNTSNFILIPRY